MKSPGFSSIAIITLALGIGANAAIFSVVNAVLLRPLPFPHAEQLVRIFGTQPQLAKAPSSPANFLDWQKQNQVFTGIAAYNGKGFNAIGGEQPERLRGLAVSADLFSILQIQPRLGRAFSAEEDRAGRGDVIVISDTLWQRRFGGDRNVIGQTVILNDKNYTVIGVMPPGFAFPDIRTELWAPLAFDAKEAAVRDTNYLAVIARLKPGVSFEQASAQMATLAHQQEIQNPTTNTGVGVKLVTLNDQIVGDIRPVLLVLLGAVGFVLLIACANVANLFLARATTRQKEMAIRSALGANRWRMIRLLLIESVLIALLGGGFGLFLAYWGIDLLVVLKPANLPRIAEIGLDRNVFAFTLGLSLLTGIAFGLVPAFQASKADVNDALKEGSRGASGGPARQRMRNVLVVSEVALSLVLLIGAGLMIRSFARLLAVDPGFKADHVMTEEVSLPESKYPTNDKQAAFFQRVEQGLRTISGVQFAAVASYLPFDGSDSTGFDVEGRAPSSPGQRPMTDYRLISADYFRAMGIPLRKGRAFNDRDNASAPGVVIINETLARQFFPNEDPIGKRIGLSGPTDWREIVGITGDVRNYGLDEEVKPESYIPYLQSAPGYLAGIASRMALIVRTGSQPAGFAAAMTNQVQALDKNQPVTYVKTMESYLAESFAQRRFNMLLLGVFATLALVLAAIGIYGVIAYTVTQRRHELGIRVALGAGAADILKLVLRHAMAMTFVGIAIGLACAFALTRFMGTLLYRIAATDPLTFIGLAALLTLVALVATFIPARRAMKVDPMVALRYE